MVQRRLSVLLLTVAPAALIVACQSSQQDQSDRRRDLAEQSCEDAVRGQLASRATAHFSPDSEHVFYDSAGGAAVTGVVATVSSPRKFACLLQPASETTWVLTNARLLD